MPDTTYTPALLAERWHCDPEKVLALIHARQLPAINTCIRPGAKRPRWVVTGEAVERFELARMTTPATPRATRRKAAKPWREYF